MTDSNNTENMSIKSIPDFGRREFLLDVSYDDEELQTILTQYRDVTNDIDLEAVVFVFNDAQNKDGSLAFEFRKETIKEFYFGAIEGIGIYELSLKVFFTPTSMVFRDYLTRTNYKYMVVCDYGDFGTITFDGRRMKRGNDGLVDMTGESFQQDNIPPIRVLELHDRNDDNVKDKNSNRLIGYLQVNGYIENFNYLPKKVEESDEK